MVRQNKWRACRFGNQAKLVNSYTYEVQTVSEVVQSLIPLLAPAAEELDCTAYLMDVQRLADEQDWAMLQRQISRRTDDRATIVRELTEISRESW